MNEITSGGPETSSSAVSRPLGRTTVLEREPGVLWRTVLDGVIVLARGSSQPLLIDAPGDTLWAFLEKPTSVDELAERLACYHVADVAQVLSDITPVLIFLLDEGAIRPLARH